MAAPDLAKQIDDLSRSVDKRFDDIVTLAERESQAIQHTFGEMRTFVTEVVGSLRQDMDRRFVGVDARFDGVDARFDGVDKRFDGVDKRFDDVDKHVEGIDRRLDRMEDKLDRALDARLRPSRRPKRG